MRKLSLVLVAMMAVSTAFAQISTGEINSSVIPRTGNRPQEGDFGMYIGASVTQIMDLVKLNQNKSAEFPDQVFWSLPAVNLKYYFTDNWEGRIGFQFGCQGATNKMRTKDYYYQHTRDINYTRFLPGVAYHFNTNNILDVYVGAQVPIGFNIDAEKMFYYIDDEGDTLYFDNSFSAFWPQIINGKECPELQQALFRAMTDSAELNSLDKVTEFLLNPSSYTEIENERLVPTDAVKEGDVVKVKLLEVDSQGRYNLSMRDCMEKPEGFVEEESAPRRGDRPNRERRGRGDRFEKRQRRDFADNSSAEEEAPHPGSRSREF